MINPKILCWQHLNGEHNEIHKHKHNFEKKHSIKGRIYPEVQIEPANMKKRHDELAKEMLRRGKNHNSPYTMPDISYLPEDQRNAKVNKVKVLVDQMNKCPECYFSMLFYTATNKYLF
jgi:hypothetical protein